MNTKQRQTRTRTGMNLAHARFVVCLTLVALLAGCAGKKPVSAVDIGWARVEEGLYAGSPLENAQPLPANITAEGAVMVKTQLLAISRLPEEVMEPLAAKARLLVTTQGENPFLATAELTLPARYGSGVEAEALAAASQAGAYGVTASAGESSWLVPAGSTAWMQLSQQGGAGERVRVAIYRPRGDIATVRVALLHQRMQEEAGGVRRPYREIALVRQAVGAEGQTVALLIPLEVKDGNVQAIVAIVRITPPSGDSRQQLEKSVASMRLAAEAAAKTREMAGPNALDPAMVTSIVEAITVGDQRRPALVYFAGQTGASLGEQVAMVADDTVLEELSLPLADTLGKGSGYWKRADAGWVMDRLAFQRLAQGFMANRLSTELRGVLAAYAGEAGRSPAALEEIAQQLSTRKDFENRLVAENVIALEDSSPAARVRAFDWLKARSRAPQGYDPLGDARERRQAMEQYLQAMAAEGNALKGQVK